MGQTDIHVLIAILCTSTGGKVNIVDSQNQQCCEMGHVDVLATSCVKGAI